MMKKDNVHFIYRIYMLEHHIVILPKNFSIQTLRRTNFENQLTIIGFRSTTQEQPGFILERFVSSQDNYTFDRMMQLNL